MIRAATEADLPGVLELAEDFARLSPWIVQAGVCPMTMMQLLLGMVHSPTALLAVAEDDGQVVGMLGAICHEAFFHAGCRIAQEIAWYVRPEVRTQTVGHALLKAFEQWALAQGARIWILATLPTSGDRVGAYLQTHGYSPGETAYVRVQEG